MMKLFVFAACVAVIACGGGPGEGEVINADGEIVPIVNPTTPVPNPTCPNGIREQVCVGSLVLREYEQGFNFINCLTNDCFRCGPGTRFSDKCQVCIHENMYRDAEYAENYCNIPQNDEVVAEGDECPNDSCPYCAYEDPHFQFATTSSKNFYCQCPFTDRPLPICRRCPIGTVFEQPEILTTGCCVAEGTQHE